MPGCTLENGPSMGDKVHVHALQGQRCSRRQQSQQHTSGRSQVWRQAECAGPGSKACAGVPTPCAAPDALRPGHLGRVTSAHPFCAFAAFVSIPCLYLLCTHVAADMMRRAVARPTITRCTHEHTGPCAHFRVRGAAAAQPNARARGAYSSEHSSGGSGERPRRLRGALAALASAVIGATAVFMYQVAPCSPTSCPWRRHNS
jgi:hypothetical protein